MSNIYSIGFGVGTCNSKGEWLEVFFPHPVIYPTDEVASAVTGTLNIDGGNVAVALEKLPVR